MFLLKPLNFDMFNHYICFKLIYIKETDILIAEYLRSIRRHEG